MNGAGPEEQSAEPARGSRARPLQAVALAALAALAAVLAPAPATGGGDRSGRGPGPGSSSGTGRTGATPAGGGLAAAACPTPATPLRYPDVQPIFEQHCAKCHDARKGKNDPAQAVFEMTTYPFATKRPATLLDDLRGMFLHRGSLSAEEKCRGTQWLAGGALDANGKPPRWR